MRKIIIIILLATCGFCIYYFYYRENISGSSLESTYSTVSASELPLVNIKAENKDILDKNIRIIKNIPEIKILSNSIVSENINDYINRFVEDEENKFIKLVDLDLLKSSIPQNIINSFSIAGKSIVYTPKILSFRFDINETFISNPQAKSRVQFMMFDVSNGSIITFENIFKNKEDALNKIYEYAESANLDKSKILKSVKENHSFSITKDGLVLVIDKDTENLDSEEIIIPFNVLQDYLDENIKAEIVSNKEYLRMSEPEMN